MDDKARAWHKDHRMPKNATVEERIEWHLAHAKICACRPIPASVAKLIGQRALGSKAGKPGTRVFQGPKR
jgi:hypothetical protein